MKFTLAAAIVFAMPVSALAEPAASAKAEIDAAFSDMDANSDGLVDRAEYGRYLNDRFARQAQSMDAAFSEMDTDKNGEISKAEAEAVPVIASAFSALDTDQSGSLSRAEMQQALVKAQSDEIAR